MGSFKDVIYKNAGLAGLADDVTKALVKFPKRGTHAVKAGRKVAQKKADEAAVHAFRNHDDILKYLTERFGPKKADEAMKKVLSDGGTGSLFADGALGLAKKNKALKPKIESGVHAFKKKLDDVDSAIGQRLGKNNKIFNQKMDIDMGLSPDGKSSDISRLTVKRLTAPFTKTKDAALPFIGAMSVGKALYPEEADENLMEEGQLNGQY
jgi:hypothetical protein